MKPELYERAVLSRDVPSENLKKGDVATLVEYLEHSSGGEEGAILEVFNAVGESIAIAPLSADHMPTVRLITENV